MADALSDERARQGEANEPSGAGNGEHVLKFRNYRPRSDKIEYQKVGLAHPDKVEEPKPEVKIDQLASVDAVIATAPKKPNWDLKRDIAKKLEKLDKRTQRALFYLAQDEEKRRLAESGGAADS